MEYKQKNFRTWLQVNKRIAQKENNLDLFHLFSDVENAYNFYHKQRNVNVVVDGWHGKSSFNIIKGIDKLTIIKFQKPSKDEEPKEVRTEITREEIDALINAMIELNARNIKVMETKDLAYFYVRKMNIAMELGHGFWKNFFSNRKLHNKFTLMLGALDKLGFTEYKKGKTKLVLGKPLSVQEVLN